MHCIKRSRFVEWARDPENYGDLYHKDFFYRLVSYNMDIWNRKQLNY